MSCLGHTKSSRIYSSTAFFIVCGGAYEGQMYWFVGAVDFVVGSLGENMAKMFILEGGFEVLEMSFEVLEMNFEVSEGRFGCLDGMIDKK